MAATKDFVIDQGRTFSQVLRWEAPPIIYKPITGITKAAPAVITAVTHGLKTGWRVAVVSVLGMTKINAANTPPKDADYHQATVLTADTVELNDVNAAGYGAYTSGGYLQYNTPVDMAGYTARMSIKDKVGGTVLASTEVAADPLDVITITLDNTNHTITIAIAAADTAAFTWKKGVYDIEMVNGAVITPLLSGNITIAKEVTT